ncbi:MAG: DUF2510 domain-containing protein [Candidatus Nanopelagicales bacterium]
MALDSYRQAHKFDAQFAGVAIRKDQLRRGLQKWPVAECEAMVDQGADVAARITATRVAVGTVILPGIGTIVGALARKNRNKIYLAITIPEDDVVLIELNSKKEGEARQFALAVNRAAKHFQDQPIATDVVESAPTTPPAGWYPFEHEQRYWDGTQWTGHSAPK